MNEVFNQMMSLHKREGLEGRSYLATEPFDEHTKWQ